MMVRYQEKKVLKLDLSYHDYLQRLRIICRNHEQHVVKLNLLVCRNPEQNILKLSLFY